MARYPSKGYANFCSQNTWGGIDTLHTYTIPIVSENLSERIERIQRNSTVKRLIRNGTLSGKRNVNGSINFEASPLSVVFGLESCLNRDSSTFSGGIHTHVFNVPDSDYNEFAATQPLTIEINKDEDNSYFFYDLQGNGFSINATEGKNVSCQLDLIGRTYSKTTQTSADYQTVNPFKWDQTSISVDSGNNLDFVDFSLNINNNLESRYTLQNTNIARKIKRSSPIDISFSAKIIAQTESFWNAFTNQTDHQLIVTFNDSTNYLKIDIPSFRIVDRSEPSETNGIYIETITGEVKWNSDSESVLTVTETNSFLMYPAWFILNDSVYGLLDQDYNFLG